MDQISFPEDFLAENVKPEDAASWTNAQVLSALDQLIRLAAEGEKTGFYSRQNVIIRWMKIPA